MSFIPKPHEIYKHFKGNLYQVTAIAEHTETGEQLVVYQALYGDFLTYARPLAMFVSRVDREKYPDAVQEFRFELQGPEAARQRAESSPFVKEKGHSLEHVGGPEANERPGARPTADGLVAADANPTASGQLSSSANPAVAGQLISKGNSVSAVLSAAVYGGSDQVLPKASLGAAKQEDMALKEEEEITIDPLVLDFLDADSYREQLNILAALHHRITDEMITTMAIASDIEINEGDTEERYEALRTCLMTLERYECNRLR